MPKYDAPKPAGALPTSPATAPGGQVAPPLPQEPPLPICVQCGDLVAVYSGPNPYKIGTGWCGVHGRVSL